MAQANASVTIVGRDEVNGAAIGIILLSINLCFEISTVVNEMESITASSNIEASADNSPKHAFIRCDASLLSNVKICADQYKSANSHLDILVLTQGIAALDGFTPTSEGIDRKLALHYYSRVGFVKCLMPFMLATVKDAPPQVLSVLSGGVHSPYTSYRSDPSLKTSFSIKNAADAAGFYNDIAVEMFSKEYPQAVFTHSSPGLVKTNWGSDFPWYIRGMVRGAQLFFMSPEDCAEYQCANLFSPQMQKCGFYIRSPSGKHMKMCECVNRTH